MYKLTKHMLQCTVPTIQLRKAMTVCVREREGLPVSPTNEVIPHADTEHRIREETRLVLMRTLLIPQHTGKAGEGSQAATYPHV